MLLLLVLLLIAGFVLRLYQLGAESIWLDEAFTYHYVTISWQELFDILKNDVHPILFYALEHWWVELFGTSETALRFLPMLFGVLSLPLLYGLTHKLYGQKTALLAVLLSTFSYTLILYSQEAKMYAQFIFFFLLLGYAFVLFLELPSWKNILFLSLANALLLHTHILSFLIIILEIFVYYVIASFQKHHNIDLMQQQFKLSSRLTPHSFLAVLVLTSLFYLPWLPIAWHQFYRLWQYLPFKFAEKFGVAVFWPLAVVALLVVVLLLWYLFSSIYTGKVFLWQQKLAQVNLKKAFIPFFICWVAINVIFREHFFGNLFYIRYLLFLLPLIHIVIARRLAQYSFKIFVTLLILYFVAAGIILNSYYAVDGKEQWREAAGYITEVEEEGDVVLFHTAGHAWWAFNYYYDADTIEQIRLYTKDDWGLVPQALEGKNHAYLILSHNYQTKEYFKEQMDRYYRFESTLKLNGITIYKYKLEKS